MAASIVIDLSVLAHSRAPYDLEPSDQGVPESAAEGLSDEVTHQTPVAVVAHSIGAAKAGHSAVVMMAGC